jgi:DSF synthase
MNAALQGLFAQPRKFTRLEWDESMAALRLHMNVKPIQCFSLAAMREFKQVLDTVAGLPRGTVKVLAVCSDVPGVYNFGGDLSLFVLLARAKSLDGLKMYGRMCIELLHWFETAAERDIFTFALVKGDALGGGLESVLPVHRILMERGAEAGFPETLFNLYPGMGAWNFTSRRCTVGVATNLVLSGAVLPAEELHRLGVVDQVVEAGDGDAALDREIRKAQPRLRGMLAALRVRSRMSPVTMSDLDAIVADWAESALGLVDRDLRLMERLARAQLKKVGGGDDGAIQEIKRLELEEAMAADASVRSANESQMGVITQPAALELAAA